MVRKLLEFRRHIETCIGEPMGLPIQVVDNFPDHKLKFRTFIPKLVRQ